MITGGHRVLVTQFWEQTIQILNLLFDKKCNVNVKVTDSEESHQKNEWKRQFITQFLLPMKFIILYWNCGKSLDQKIKKRVKCCFKKYIISYPWKEKIGAMLGKVTDLIKLCEIIH